MSSLASARREDFFYDVFVSLNAWLIPALPLSAKVCLIATVTEGAAPGHG
jgi:hypothetical protein